MIQVVPIVLLSVVLLGHPVVGYAQVNRRLATESLKLGTMQSTVEKIMKTRP